ncbi:MAG: GNAT family N-acetyltransferase [Caldilineaceae bacterium]
MASELLFRQATADDLPAIVAMLADDALGAAREDSSLPLAAGYLSAFAAIDADPNNELIVACLGETIVGVLQLTFIPYLTYKGSWRALIEGVRVAKSYRSQGVGKRLFVWAIERAKERNCRIVQLTTDKARVDAKRFYENLGFQATHEEMKLHLVED